MPKLAKLPPRISMADPARKGWTAQGRASTTERGYGWAWQLLRDRIMVRDHGLCVPCRSVGLVSLATSVDHITNKARGGDDAPANLQAICTECHAAKTAAEAQGREWEGKQSP